MYINYKKNKLASVCKKLNCDRIINIDYTDNIFFSIL